jgi:spermidine synthase
MRDGSGTVRFLLHGTTQHGREYIDELRRCEPLSYYHRAGPFGSITSALAGQTSARVAVVGLGAGATASYGVSGQEWTFYEIDPAVVRIARDSGYFSYIRDCSSAAINFVVGDGRLRLKEAPENYYSLIALDAFSSDAIPLHLLTREAVGVYLSKLANGGLLAFHISNRHLDLSPVLGSIAKSYGLTALIMRDGRVVAEGKDASIWVVLARSPEDLKPLTVNDRWETLEPPDNFRVWTDDFSNIFSVLWR